MTTTCVPKLISKRKAACIDVMIYVIRVMHQGQIGTFLPVYSQQGAQRKF